MCLYVEKRADMLKCTCKAKDADCKEHHAIQPKLQVFWSHIHDIEQKVFTTTVLNGFLVTS